jgi:hypothetical protein
MFYAGIIPWHEAIIKSNIYKEGNGCCVTVRSHLQPIVWWLRINAETSITLGNLSFQNFADIRLPRLIIYNDSNYD